MVPRREVVSLVRLCSEEVPGLVRTQVTSLTSHLVKLWSQQRARAEKPGWKFVNREKVVLASGRVREMEEEVVAEGEFEFEFREDIDQYDLTHIEEDSWVTRRVDEAVTRYREYLMEWPVPHIVDSLASSVIQGLEETIVNRNSRMHLSDKPAEISQLNLEMFLLLRFSSLVLVENLARLDLRERLQPVRNYLYERLELLPGLRDLQLGEASHGYTPELFRSKFLAGVSNMKRLVQFSLHFDCFDQLISALAENCGASLKVLDVEQSLNVTDESVESMQCFTELRDLNIFSCGFTTEGQARLLTGLPSLLNLRRGDFLCDALEWVEQQARLNITEFFSSESYHFHSVQQMETVARICPSIRKMRFIFSKEHFISYVNLAAFRNIQELHLCGGDFYDDNLIDLLELVGHNLTDLDLYAVDQIDTKAIAMISIYCKQLVRLSFSQCGFKSTVEEIYNEGRPEEVRDLRPTRAELPVENLIQNWNVLETLKISSHCHPDYVRLVLAKCLNLKHLEIGRAVSMSDWDFSQIFSGHPSQSVSNSPNQLVSLESFYMKESEDMSLTIATVENILDSCPHLKRLTDIRNWCGVYPRETKELLRRVESNNWDLYLGEDLENLSEDALRRAGLKEKFDRLREQFGDMVMIP